VLNFIQNDKRRRVLLQKSQHLQISYQKMCFYIVTSINGRGTIMSIPRTTSQFHGCDSILNPMRPYKVTNDRKMDNPGNKTQDGDKHNNNKQTKTSTTQKTKKMSNTGPHQKPEVNTGAREE
jgi:hypothetical protein